MESNKKMARKSSRRRLTYKHNTVNEIIRTITLKLPDGNTFYHRSRARNLQHIIQYVTYLEKTIEQVSREKNLSLEFDYKILTNDYVNPNKSDDDHVQRVELENVIDNSSSSCTSTATTTSGYVSENSTSTEINEN